MKTEYRIVGSFVKDPNKKHVVDFNKKWTKAQAEFRMQQILKQQEQAKLKGEHINGIISSPFYSEYELINVHIESRQVTEWK